MSQADIRATFLDFLDRHGYPYHEDHQTHRLQVRRTLHIEASGLAALPDNLTIDGHLFLKGMDLPRLPNGLSVVQSLCADDTPITHLPQDLSVGESLSLGGSQVAVLPDNLTLPGDLNLINTPIQALPKHLYVGGHLMLQGTRVVRLPEVLTVFGEIHPPKTLQDIRNFVAQRPDINHVTVPRSWHARMQAHSIQEHFPDLWTVIHAMRSTRRLLLKDEVGNCRPWLEWMTD